MLKNLVFTLLLSIVFGLFQQTAAQTNKNGSCLTPNNTKGHCVIITECESVYKILEKRPYTSEDADYLRQSEVDCGFEGSLPIVCCPQDIQAMTEPVNEYLTAKPASSPLLPSTNDCGFIGVDFKITGGTNASLREFIWMARVEYKKGNGKRGYYYCAGALINNRYVLTAAHCINGSIVPPSWKVVGVRLGEYNTETEIDCDPTGLDCNDPAYNVDVEKIIVHELYKKHNRNQYHDIALLRLAKPVNFTRSVGPICLPTTADLQAVSLEDTLLWVSGWGKTENSSSSTIQLKVSIKVTNSSKCSEKYYNLSRIQIRDNQICAGGKNGKDSCDGDSGGPLMGILTDSTNQLSFYAVGIVSWGRTECGAEDWPGVYVKVSHYVSWIVSHLEP